MKKSPINKLFLLMAIFAIFLAACGGNGDVISEEPTKDSDQASTNDADTTDDSQEDGSSAELPDPSDMVSKGVRLDPATVDLDDEDSLMLSRFVYEGLVGMASNGEIVSALAESWTVSEDQLDYVFVLRPDAVFHDGTPVTADAVTANFNRWFDPDNELHGNSTYEAWEEYFLGFKGEFNDDETPVSFFDGIEKVDDRTVLIHLNKIEENFLEYISKPQFSILNPETLASAGANYGTSADTVSGTGPYKVSEWTGSALVLEPYTEYWGTMPEENLEFGLE